MEAERWARDSAPARYRPRRPSQSVLYRCVQEHLETWLAQCRDGHDDNDDGPVPPYVEREFRRYLECGFLARGFARARCGRCGHDFLIAFSCKERSVCPSCNARRMFETAAHLADHVLPRLPVRQWVLAVPKRLRYFLRRDADLQGAALRVFLRVVEQHLRAHSPGSGPSARSRSFTASGRRSMSCAPQIFDPGRPHPAAPLSLSCVMIAA
jgi:Transposase zinc-binding domain